MSREQFCIELTRFETGNPIQVLVSHIVTFCEVVEKPKKEDEKELVYVAIELSNGKTLKVKESPAIILQKGRASNVIVPLK